MCSHQSVVFTTIAMANVLSAMRNTSLTWMLFARRKIQIVNPLIKLSLHAPNVFRSFILIQQTVFAIRINNIVSPTPKRISARNVKEI